MSYTHPKSQKLRVFKIIAKEVKRLKSAGDPKSA